jgi:hypothetical protein
MKACSMPSAGVWMCIAGTAAAVTAARLGLTVALIQDRPVLGGNASSEVRVWPEGHVNQPPYERVGDVVMEIVPERRADSRNAQSADVFDDDRKLRVARAEPNITLFLERRMNEASADDGLIRSVVCQHVRTAERTRVHGRWFLDSTGDASLGFLVGADYEQTDTGHMGASNLWNIKCLCEDEDPLSSELQAACEEAAFPRCPWAVDLTDRPFPGRTSGATTPEPGANPISLGESRRLMGDVVLRGDDLRRGTTFADGCFPCTWGIDTHFPDPKYSEGHEGDEFIADYTRGDGFEYQRPYWVPYRCLYSRNVRNLFMAGRDISVTHEALGAVRVMKTTGAMGEIVGMAAAVCKANDCDPREVYSRYLDELLQRMRVGAGRSQAADADGVLRLEARVARISGTQLRYEADRDALGYWRTMSETPAWGIEVPVAGRYDVTATYACTDDEAGGSYTIRCDDGNGTIRQVDAAVESTGAKGAARQESRDHSGAGTSRVSAPPSGGPVRCRCTAKRPDAMSTAMCAAIGSHNEPDST